MGKVACCSCELLSICIFEILNTTFVLILQYFLMLWIAFDLYLWNIEHNLALEIAYARLVVNCFRFVSLKYWTQRHVEADTIEVCCELLSICIFEILNTTNNSYSIIWYCVVNCFRFVSLKYWTQLLILSLQLLCRCELLSICIFEILNTTRLKDSSEPGMLWIAFDLYLWNIEHN